MISLASPDALYPLVRESISGALDFMIRRAIVETAIEFCRESQLVQDTVGPVSVAAGDSVLLVPADQPYQGRQLIRVFGEQITYYPAARNVLETDLCKCVGWVRYS
ncbi:hypothetical protein RQL81_13215 [Citrobacter braakii]|jgi:hypothetical protein|nr:hypothetical protein [Citrobacter freundii]MCI1825335.1 hypothetical protein [Citrobacter freundii]MDT7115505.1 hypothetical protein [Citrobacter braakii]